MPMLVTPACTVATAVGVVDAEDAVHAHHAHDDGCLRDGAGAPPERLVPAPRGMIADAVGVKDSFRMAATLLGGLGQDDGQGGLAEGGEAVRLVGFRRRKGARR